MPDFIITEAQVLDILFAKEISSLYKFSSQKRGTGIALRTEQYIAQKIMSGKAIIAKQGEKLAGFCYIETFSNSTYVSNSGLIVKEEYRSQGLASAIKEQTFRLARDKFPAAKVFGITTSGAVMKINSKLGYIPVTFNELTSDAEFWDACQTCPNYDILQRNQRKNCICTAMLAPSKEESMKKKLDKNLIKNKP